jgi:uncharacterized protein (TIGR00369 family)
MDVGMTITRFEPKNPDYRQVVSAVFATQPAMRTLGVSVARLEPGMAELEMPYSADFSQQNGFVHSGILAAAMDNACGVAALTLMPAISNMLTVEFKINMLSPAKGERFLLRAEVIKPGRTIVFCDARAVAVENGSESLVATMTTTMMVIARHA